MSLPEWREDSPRYIGGMELVKRFGLRKDESEEPEGVQTYKRRARERLSRLDSRVNHVKVTLEGAAALTRAVKEHALSMGVDLVGVSPVHQFYLYRGADVRHRFAVSLVKGMDYDRLRDPLGPAALLEVWRVYDVVGEAAVELAEHIRGLGYPARAHTVYSREVMQIPHAVMAGLGELGKHGVMVNPELGSCLRLATVTTDLPLQVDKARDLGVQRFCGSCDLCVRHCPAGAIPRERETVRGVEKWVMRTERCITYFATRYGCSVCISVCPFNARARRGLFKEAYIETVQGLERGKRRAA